MQHDPCMRAAARAIFETFFADETGAAFVAAEAAGTARYRQAIEAAQLARLHLIAIEPQPEQLGLLDRLR